MFSSGRQFSCYGHLYDISIDLIYMVHFSSMQLIFFHNDLYIASSVCNINLALMLIMCMLDIRPLELLMLEGRRVL